MDSPSPTYRLNDGSTLPAIGFGTYPLRGPDGVAAMTEAIQAGYRLLDTAVNYRNEEEVGQAVRASGIDPALVRITTKIPGRFHQYELARQCLVDSAQRLGVEQLGMALIHWPNPSQDRYPQAWRALVDAQRDGLVRSIGVSNFTAAHLARIIDETGVVPAVNQVELHPYFPQTQLLAEHDRLGVRTQAWSPLAKASAPYAEPPVQAAAAAHGVSPAQVVLRWHVELGSLPLPKSATPQRQRENLDIFGFRLTPAQVAAITALGRPDGRLFDGDPATHEEM